MEAAILAGGLGTRLKSVINDVPKPMAPVNGKPFLEYLFDYLNNKGFNRVVLLIGYKATVIVNHFGDKYKNIDIGSYPYFKEKPGTILVLRSTEEDLLKKCEEDVKKTCYLIKISF